MRTNGPRRGDPWPHDMVLTVTCDSSPLLDLLWIRQAWDLDPIGADLPPLMAGAPSLPPHDDRHGADQRQLARAWTQIWSAALLHAGSPRGDDIHEALQHTDDGSPERARLLARALGPSWRSEFGDSGFGDAYQQWADGLQQKRMDEHRLPLDQTPERRCLPAVVRAWKHGLRTIVTIPVLGSCTRTIGDEALLVADRTRADPALYAQALEEFSPGA